MADDKKVVSVALPLGKEPTLRLVSLSADSNATGDIFGGWVMAQVDIADSIPAMRLERGRVVALAIN